MTPINTTLSQPHVAPAPKTGSALVRVMGWIIQGHTNFVATQNRIDAHGTHF